MDESMTPQELAEEFQRRAQELKKTRDRAIEQAYEDWFKATKALADELIDATPLD